MFSLTMSTPLFPLHGSGWFSTCCHTICSTVHRYNVNTGKTRVWNAAGLTPPNLEGLGDNVWVWVGNQNPSNHRRRTRGPRHTIGHATIPATPAATPARPAQPIAQPHPSLGRPASLMTPVNILCPAAVTNFASCAPK